MSTNDKVAQRKKKAFVILDLIQMTIDRASNTRYYMKIAYLDTMP